MALESTLKTSLDELRMQMLGAQVLFGFQLQGLFQDTFIELPNSVRVVDTTALAMTISVLTLLLAVPCQHRIVEQGEASLRIFRLSMRYANYALFPLAAMISCDIYAATRLPFGIARSAVLASITFLIALGAWYGAGTYLRQHGDQQRGDSPLRETKANLHAKIEQMLTEARVILPGAQALLGFQLIVMMTRSFGELPSGMQRVHLIALLSLMLTVVLLIAPAAVHRLAFEGRDNPRLHAVGSRIIAIALLPLVFAIACDVWVALFRLQGGSIVPGVGGLMTACLLVGFWYVMPLIVRLRIRSRAA
jgi:Family of unknown function (DUF6328)